MKLDICSSLRSVRVVVLVSLSLGLVDELTLQLLLHLAHHPVLRLHVLLRLHHNGLPVRSLHHHGLTLRHGRHLLWVSSHGRHHRLLVSQRRHNWLQLNLQGAPEVGVVDIVQNDVHVHFAQAFLFNEVLDREHV